MTVSRQEWADWVRSSVTQAVIQSLETRSRSLIEEMLAITAETAEGFGLAHIAYRNKLDGLGEFLDLDSLADLVEVSDAN